MGLSPRVQQGPTSQKTKKNTGFFSSSVATLMVIAGPKPFLDSKTTPQTVWSPLL